MLTDPKPNIMIEALGDSTVNMRFYGWVDQRESDFMKSKSEAIRLVKVAFDDADVEMPEPIYRVLLHQPGSDPEPKPNKPIVQIDAEEDVSVDTTIDEQVAAIRDAEDEENLLTTKDED